MTLTVYFYDRKGLSLQSPETIGGYDRAGAYEVAARMGDALEAKRGVKVYLHTMEAP